VTHAGTTAGELGAQRRLPDRVIDVAELQALVDRLIAHGYVVIAPTV
jgi:hypothetical protein